MKKKIEVEEEKEEDEDDYYLEGYDDIIEQLGECSKFYLKMDICLDKNNKSFHKCNKEIKLLRKCWINIEKEGKRDLKKEREAIIKLNNIKKEIYLKNKIEK
jgi:hypothetical protein